MEDIITNFIDYIKEEYNLLNNNKINNCSNIRRYTMPIMAGNVENGIAILLNNILKKKKYNYLIDPQLSIGKRQVIRPDIIIYDNNFEIHGIIEVKSQLGYSEIDKTEYKKRIKKIKDAAKKAKLKVNKAFTDNQEDKPTYFSVSQTCKDCIIILMNANDHGKTEEIEKIKDINYFLLFKGEKNEELWYDTLSEKFINKDKRGFKDLVDFIEKLEDHTM